MAELMLPILLLVLAGACVWLKAKPILTARHCLQVFGTISCNCTKFRVFQRNKPDIGNYPMNFVKMCVYLLLNETITAEWVWMKYVVSTHRHKDLNCDIFNIQKFNGITILSLNKNEQGFVREGSRFRTSQVLYRNQYEWCCSS